MGNHSFTTMAPNHNNRDVNEVLGHAKEAKEFNQGQEAPMVIKIDPDALKNLPPMKKPALADENKGNTRPKNK